MNIPVYQLAFPGGDTHVVGNFEYRIPIFGPVVLAIFADAGIDRILRPGQLNMDPSRIDYLNNEYPTAGFQGKAIVYPGTQKPRMSTGLELQVLLPVVQAPFRVYWAYNPLLVREYLQPPIVYDRSVFPNAATFDNAILSYGNAYPFLEQHDMFRFTIGRTF
jgi:outer membrane protein insertion porin family